MFVLVRCQIAGLFVNRFTPDEKYSPQNINIFLQPIQTQLSQKPKNFSQSFIGFLKFTLNFKHFLEKDESSS